MHINKIKDISQAGRSADSRFGEPKNPWGPKAPTGRPLGSRASLPNWRWQPKELKAAAGDFLVEKQRLVAWCSSQISRWLDMLIKYLVFI